MKVNDFEKQDMSRHVIIAHLVSEKEFLPQAPISIRMTAMNLSIAWVRLRLGPERMDKRKCYFLATAFSSKRLILYTSRPGGVLGQLQLRDCCLKSRIFLQECEVWVAGDLDNIRRALIETFFDPFECFFPVT